MRAAALMEAATNGSATSRSSVSNSLDLPLSGSADVTCR
jgi:hypothetical protein